MSEQRADKVRAGQLKLLALLAVFVLPVLAAVVWYFALPWVAPPPSVNGELIEPARPLQAFELTRADGSSYRLDDLRGHWTLVHVIDERCGAGCRERVHYTRQIRDALGEDRIRVERIALARAGATTPGLADLLPDHPRLTVLESPADGPLRTQLPAVSGDGETVFVIDPLGNLMLRFDPHVAPTDMLDDLEHLLKLSRIG